MYNDYISEREIYNEETYSLFSHRPDIKKRNYITTQPKREVDTSSIEVFLFGIGILCMAVAVMLV